MFSRIISTGLILSSLSLVFASFGVETIASIQCTQNLKKELESQIDRYQTLASLPSPQENKAKIQSDLNQIKTQRNKILETDLEDKIKSLAKTQIQSEFAKLNLPKTSIDSALSVENTAEKEGKIGGIISEKRIYNYADGEFGAGSSSYDFVYDSKTESLNLVKKPEFINAAEKTLEPDIPEAQKQAILNQKEINTRNNRGISKEEQIKEIKKDKKSEYQSKLENFKKDLINANCSGVRAKAAGVYNGSDASAYAQLYHNSGPYGFHYYEGGDCTNFASQSVYYGGIDMDYGYSEDSAYWYSKQLAPYIHDVARSWRVVGNMMDHMYYYENTGYWLDFDSSGYQIFNPLQTGDLLYADWNRDGIWDHSMIITGWDWINGHWEPKLSYHTTDRLNIPFAQLRGGNPRFRGLQIFQIAF